MSNIKRNIDTDTWNLFPLNSGKIPASSAALKKFSQLEDDKRKTFHFDQHFNWFRENKLKLKQERLTKYYQKLDKVNLQEIIQFIITTLEKEWPQFFSYKENKLFCELTKEILEFDDKFNLINNQIYIDAFEALSMQVQEDIVIFCVPNNPQENDFVERAHLTSADDWSAEWALGKSFGDIHNGVIKSDNTKVIKFPEGMVQGLVRMSEPCERVGAFSFRSHVTLNMHPENYIQNTWNWDSPEQEFWARFERQTITPFKNLSCFLFTVRVYFVDLEGPNRIKQTIEALKTEEPNVFYRYRELMKTQAPSMLAYLEKKNVEQDERK